MGADGKRELMPKGEHEEVESETAAEAAAPLASTTPQAGTTASFMAMDELGEQARLELEEMLFATPPVKGSADSGAFYSPSNQICATPLRDATLGSLCTSLGSPASPVTCPADEHTLMDNNMDGAGDDDDTESPDTRDDCHDSACACLLCCFAAADKLTAENHSAAKDAFCTRRTSSLHIGRRRFSATQDDRDIILERSLSPDNPFGRTISAPPLRDATPWTLCDPSGSLTTPVTRAAAALVHDLPPHAWVRCVLDGTSRVLRRSILSMTVTTTALTIALPSQYGSTPPPSPRPRRSSNSSFFNGTRRRHRWSLPFLLCRMRSMSQCLFDSRSAPLKGSPDLRPTSAYCICTPRFSTLDGPRIR